MTQKALTKQQLQDAVNLLAIHDTVLAAAAAAKLPYNTFASRIRRARSEGFTPTVEEASSTGSLKQRIKMLEAALRSAEQQQSISETIRKIIGSMGAKISELHPPEFLTKSRNKESAPGVPSLFLSDLHWGEVVNPGQINGVNRYNVRVANERLDTCVESAIHLLRILSPNMDYPGIVLMLGGDMISGNIHDELVATNEINSMPAVLDLYSRLVGVIGHLADAFGKVFVPCVSGNHGRDTHKIWAKDRNHTSFDWLLYQFLAKHFEADKRVTFFVPDGPDAYYRVFNHRYLLTHGDQFRGGDGMIGALGPIIRGDHKKRSRNAQIDMEYDVMCMGHWHQYIHLTRLIVNGSLKGYDEYAYSGNFGFEPPQQALWITHPKYGITFRMPVYVDRMREPPKTAWVSVAA